MEIDEHHIQVAINVLEDGGTIPGAAGRISKITPPDTDLSYLIATANKANQRIKQRQQEATNN